jgi:hypothetical protein
VDSDVKTKESTLRVSSDTSSAEVSPALVAPNALAARSMLPTANANFFTIGSIPIPLSKLRLPTQCNGLATSTAFITGGKSSRRDKENAADGLSAASIRGI